MAHCSITLNDLGCVRTQNANGDELFLRWAFHADGSRPTFHRRPQSGFWTVRRGDVRSLSDQVVNQSIFLNQLYWFHLELWGSGTGRNLDTRFSSRVTYIMRGWGRAAAIPGASAVAFFGALFGLGRGDVFLDSVKLPVLVMQVDDQPPIGLGAFSYVLTGRLGDSHDHVTYAVVLT